MIPYRSSFAFLVSRIQLYPGSIIVSLGAELVIEESCFEQNYLVGDRLRGYSASIMLVGDNAPTLITSTGNYAQKRGPSNFVSYEQCLFLGRLLSEGGLICIANNADASECPSSMKDVTVDW